MKYSEGRDSIDVGTRLKAWREAMGKTVSEFATENGMGISGYSQFETGARMLTRDAAIRIADNYPGLSIDFIFRGKSETLSHSARTALEGIPTESRTSKS